jgi:hypothetical protein
MAVFRIYLADGDRRVKADLKARDEVFARMSAERWLVMADGGSPKSNSFLTSNPNFD